MEPRISIVTLGVKNLTRSWKFYKKGLGFPTGRKFNTPEGGIVFFKLKNIVLALYPYDALAEDVGKSFKVKRSKFPGITLAHNVNTDRDVDAVLAKARRAGAKIVKRAQKVFWGGYSGYFADPDGYLWEVARGTSPLNPVGSVPVD